MANYVLNDEKMFADVTDGIAIIINGETGIYYGLNALGTSVYENIINGASVEDILAALKSFSGAPASIETDLNDFINSMIEKDVLISAPASSADVNISEETAKEDDFKFVFGEYNDAQELLLADPIHEVKEETGWTPEKESIGYTKDETVEREMKSEDI